METCKEQIRWSLDQIDRLADICRCDVEEWQKQLHSIPEPGMKEYETSQFLREKLTEMEIPFQEIEPTGLVADFGHGSHCIALRADMDGLHIQEQTDLPWKSQHEGYMHACGHDGHMAALLGVAVLLKQYESSLNLRVRLIFQPSEENCQGAKHMIQAGALEDVEEIYGLHLFTDLPTGVISLDPGPRMAITDRFEVRLRGKGGRAGKPHQCVDATVAAAAVIMNLQTIVSRHLDPMEHAVLTVGHLTSGSQYNIIAETAEFEGTIRTFSEAVERDMKDTFCHTVRKTCEVYGVEAQIAYHPSEHPVVFNDPKRSVALKEDALKLWGSGVVKDIPAIMLGEDFSVYQSRIPGVFAFVGSGDPEKGCIYPNHHPAFCLDPQALYMALKVYLLYILHKNGEYCDD